MHKRPIDLLHSQPIKFFIWALFGFFLFTALKQKKTMVWGLLLPMTGPLGTIGSEAKEGVDLAMEHINSQSPVTIKLQVADTRGNASEASLAMNNLIQHNGAELIIGEFISQNTLAAASIAKAKKVPLISPGSTLHGLTENNPYLFRVCFEDIAEGQYLATFAWSKGLRRVALMIENQSTFSEGLGRAFSLAFEKKGGVVLGKVAYQKGETQFKSYLSKLALLKPQAVVLPAYYDSVGMILREAHSQKLSFPFLGVDGWESPKLFELAGPGAKGHFMVTHFSPHDTQEGPGQTFVKQFKKKFGKNPGVIGALSYDAALLAYHATLKNQFKGGGTALAKTLSQTENWPGVTGNLTFDAQRNPIKSAVILKTTETDYIFITRLNP